MGSEHQSFRCCWTVAQLPPVCAPHTRIKGLLGNLQQPGLAKDPGEVPLVHPPQGCPGTGAGESPTLSSTHPDIKTITEVLHKAQVYNLLPSEEVTAQALRGSSGCQRNGRDITVLTQIRQNLTPINPSDQGHWFVLFSICSVFKASAVFFRRYTAIVNNYKCIKNTGAF